MTQLIFASGNKEKFSIAQTVCRANGIELVQQSAEIDEIQSEDLASVVRDKARRAFESLGQPVVVSDDAWSVPALNGFPGPYMKSIDHWFTPQDWLDLMQHKTDRRITLIQQLAYQDADTFQLIRKEYTGELLTKARGTYGKTLQKVVTMPGDKGLSISEVYDRGIMHDDREVLEGWQEFIAWYKTLHAKQKTITSFL